MLAAHHIQGGFALIILAVLTLFGAIFAGICAIISDGVDQHHRWISQHTPEQQAAVRKAERVAAGAQLQQVLWRCMSTTSA